MARDHSELDENDTFDGISTGGNDSGINRRRFLKSAAGATAATAFASNVASASGHNSEIVQLDYDEYYNASRSHNGLEDIYRLSGQGDGEFKLTQEFSHSGDTAQVHTYGSRSQRTSNVQFWLDYHTNSSQVEELYSEFYVYFPEDFMVPGDGTHRFYWVGYRSGDCASGTRCVPSGDDGWSIVTSIAGPDRGNVHNPPDTYELRVGLYHMDQMSDPNPTGATFRTGEWTKLGYYFKLNSYSGGNASRDGIVRAWINGEFVWERNDIAFVNTSGEGMTHNGMMGYRWPSDSDELIGQSWYYDDHTYYLGDAIPDFARQGTDNPDGGSPSNPDSGGSGDSLLEEYDERFTYRDPEAESAYKLYVDGEIVQHDWGQATENDTVEISEQSGYQVVSAMSPVDNIDAYVFDGEIVAISSESEPGGMWISGEEVFLDDYPDVPEDFDEGDGEDEDSAEDEDLLEQYDERFTYRDPEAESEYKLYVDGEIVQHDWSQATWNDTVEIAEQSGYQVVSATSPADNVDGYVFDGDVVAISSEHEPGGMWISGQSISLDDYPDVPDDFEEDPIADYRNEDGEVDTVGLIAALNDWNNDEISSETMNEVLAAWEENKQDLL